ncbi:phage tail protein [Methylovirgula sp. 4M-Z18]|uniref:phage tail protein n=1 Tax=Methylovirgula sp. 4M-Z18 TaxID=2293567 RepID=UPI000E2F715B|nr:phage tail protein [Methylovirgula sp. 4M-Z18]RFB80010.1 phage tail protein [Methylovirgula sp. 4M-Z18]
MPISQLGQINISALNVPDAYVQIAPPQFLFNGVSTNKGGFVGTAAWGPVNAPQPFANYSQYATVFGPTINRLYDMGGHVFLAAAQGGAGAFYGVRVTDGTDTAATATLGNTGVMLTAKYTGSLGNNLTATISQGSQNGLAVRASGSIAFTTNPTAAQTVTIGTTVFTAVASGATAVQFNIGATLQATLANLLATLQASTDANAVKCFYALGGTTLNITAKAAGTAGNAIALAATAGTASGATLTGGVAPSSTVKLTLAMPGFQPEQFDNIGLGLSGNALWVAIANAVNNGTSSVRGPSNLAIATAGASTATPLNGTTTFSGGTDGANSVTTATLIGVDAAPRSGMYALRGTGVAQAMLCDCADINSFSQQVAFGLDVGCYMIGCTPAGDTIQNAINELGNAGIDTFTMKVLFGDWIYWLDTTNNVPMRLSSPQSVAMGVLCNLSPQNSSLNKPVQAIIGTQKSLTGVQYSSSDLQLLGQAQMDVIANPEPGGNYFACRFGKNASSNQVIFGDEYTRVTYFLAKSLLVIAGKFVGQTQSTTERLQAKTALTAFLQLAVQNSIIGTPDGSQAFQVVLDASNNPQASVALGYQYAYIKAIYLGIVRYFVVNLEGGASVTISNTPPVQ